MLSRESSHQASTKVRASRNLAAGFAFMTTHSTHSTQSTLRFRLALVRLEQQPLIFRFHGWPTAACSALLRCVVADDDGHHDQDHNTKQKEAETSVLFVRPPRLGLPDHKLISISHTNFRLGLLGQVHLIITATHCQDMSKQGLPQEILPSRSRWFSRRHNPGLVALII